MPEFDSEDPRISNLLGAVEREIVFLEVIGRRFVDQEVYLDGRYWHQCTFERCTLVSRAGLFRMGTCTFVDHKGALLNGPAARIFQLLKASEKAGGHLSVAIDMVGPPRGPVV